MNAHNNKFLTLQAEVVLTQIIEPVIVELDGYFAAMNHKAIVTSGLRDAEAQLRIIKHYAAKHSIGEEYPEILTVEDTTTKSHYVVNDKAVYIYVWQRAWSRLLNLGMIVNPPHAAECLFNYFRNGLNKRGQIIGESPHFKGTAFDIGGGANNADEEMAIVQRALDEDLLGLKGYLLERNNNCLHVDCEKV